MLEPNAATAGECPVVVELTPRVKDPISTVLAQTPAYAARPDQWRAAAVEARAMYEGLTNVGRHTSLHENQVVALLLYVYHLGETGSPAASLYHAVNAGLREHRAEDTRAYSDFLYYLLTGLRRLEKVEAPTVVYRQTTEHVDLEHYRPGMPVCWASFTSASLSADKAAAAVVGIEGEPGTLFVITPLDARRLRLPRFAEEDEVLFEPNSEFTVKSLVPSHSFQAPHRIFLEQTPSTKPLLPPLAPQASDGHVIL
jgi:hypothetical protein